MVLLNSEEMLIIMQECINMTRDMLPDMTNEERAFVEGMQHITNLMVEQYYLISEEASILQ